MVLWILSCLLRFRLQDYHPLWSLFPKCSAILVESIIQSATPEILLLQVWPIPISLAATLRIDFSFSSWRYLDVSVHVVPLHTLWIYVWILEVCSSRFPHSDISGSRAICASPKLFAAYHVFHRLLVPRHSPYALSCLTIAWNSSDTIRLLMFVNCLCNLLNLFSRFFWLYTYIQFSRCCFILLH